MVSLGYSRSRCSSKLRITAATLLSWLALSASGASAHLDPASHTLPVVASPNVGLNSPAGSIESAEHDFTLRHVFHRGTKAHPGLHRRLDVKAGMMAYSHPPMAEGIWVDLGPFPARSHAHAIQRLEDRRSERIIGMEAHARRGGYRPVLPESDWTIDEIAGPNITDQKTVISLAKMAAVAYNQGPDDPEWMDVGKPYNRSADFGWQSDGLRGHIFADKNNNTVVISIKGTSKAVFDGAETTSNDKENDNLFFGCCCGDGGSSMLRKVCSCATDTFTCNNTCVTEELKKENRYWRASVDLFYNVTELYPNTSNVWLVGHSLGGSVSSLLGLTVGVPAVTFEAPGDALAANRLGLPVPPGLEATALSQKRRLTAAYHFGHNADPIFTGTCTGLTASCVWGGYAMESQCHTGMICEYDMQKDWGWRNVMTNHGIRACISGVYEKYDRPAKCISDADCDSDCFKWKYFESNGSDISTTRTSSSTTATYTRTETCKTPGWWGCLDESTTPSITTTVTETLTTTTCASYGWFGRCLDPITTTETLTTTVTEATSVLASTTESSVSTTSTSTSTTITCTSYGWFGRCLDEETSLSSTTSAVSQTDVQAAHITKAPKFIEELR